MLPEKEPGIIELTDISELVHDTEGSAIETITYDRLLVPTEFETRDDNDLFSAREIQEHLKAKGSGWFIPSTALAFNVLNRLLQEFGNNEAVERLVRSYAQDWYIQTSDLVVQEGEGLTIYRYPDENQALESLTTQNDISARFKIHLTLDEIELLGGLGSWCYQQQENEDTTFATHEELSGIRDVLLLGQGPRPRGETQDTLTRNLRTGARTPAIQKALQIDGWKKVLGMTGDDLIEFIKRVDRYVSDLPQDTVEPQTINCPVSSDSFLRYPCVSSIQLGRDATKNYGFDFRPISPNPTRYNLFCKG